MGSGSLISCLFATLLASQAALAASQAASLVNAANQIPDGEYYIYNTGTGQVLGGGKTDMYPTNGQGTPIQVAGHIGSDHARHTTLGKGTRGDRKCASAQWVNGGSTDTAGAMYECVLGVLASGNSGHSSLRPAKQAFILIPATNSKGKRDDISGSVALDERSLFDDVSDDGLDEPMKDAYVPAIPEKMLNFEKRSKHHKASGGKKLSSSSGYGPFYIVTTDHLTDQAPRALSNQVVESLGQKVLKLSSFQKGNKDQMWTFRKA